jgi:hypothetical protein
MKKIVSETIAVKSRVNSKITSKLSFKANGGLIPIRYVTKLSEERKD